MVLVCQGPGVYGFGVAFAFQALGQLLASFYGVPRRFASVHPVLWVGAGNRGAGHHLIGASCRGFGPFISGFGACLLCPSKGLGNGCLVRSVLITSMP